MTGKREVQRSVGRVHGRLGRRADGGSVLSDEDDKFFDGTHKTTGYPESVPCQKTLTTVAKR